MANVAIDKLARAPGLSLYTDLCYAGELEQVDSISAGTTYYSLANFRGNRLHRLYRVVSSVFTLFTDYIVLSDNLSLGAAQPSTVYCIPKNVLRLLQIDKRFSQAYPVYIKKSSVFDYGSFSITSFDYVTNAVGNILFSLTEKGTYTDSVNSASVPDIVWVKSTEKIGVIRLSTAIVLTTDVYV